MKPKQFNKSFSVLAQNIHTLGRRDMLKIKRAIYRTSLLTLCLGLSFLLVAPPLFADEGQDSIWTRDKLTGDWGGLRSKWEEHGIGLDFRLSQYYQDVASGGIETGGEYAGLLDFIANVEGEKLGLWKGLFLNMHVQYQYGNGIIPYAGLLPLNNVSLLYPAPDWSEVQITGWTISQQLYQKAAKTVLLSAGKINVNDLLSEAFPYLEMNTTGFMNYNVNFPAATISRFIALSHLGAALITLKGTEIQGAIAVLDTQNSSTNSGFDDAFTNGATYLAAYRFFFDVKDKPGDLLFLYTTSSGKYTSLQDTGYGPIVPILDPDFELAQKRYPWAVVAYYNQIVWGKGEQNVRFILGAGMADKNPSFARWQINTQIVATGVFDSRPKDRFGFGGYYVGPTDDVKTLSQDALLIPDLGNYWGIEMFYTYAVTPAIYLTGDLQITTNMAKDDNAAIIPGLRLVMEF